MSLFGGMKIYTVYIRPGEAQAYEKPVFVKEGFNLWAFLLTFVWLLYKRLWLPAIGVFIINIVLLGMAKDHAVGPAGALIFDLGWHVLVGYFANDWLRAKLARRGYIMADVAASDSLLRAEQRYFERYLTA